MEPAANSNVADAAATVAATMTSNDDQKIWERPRKGPTETLRDMKSAVREAGNAALALQRAGLSRMEKDGFYDIVTEGDITSQRVAMGGLAKSLPELPFLAEESDDQAMVPGVPQSRVDDDGFIHARDYLALDPVDGTTNFANGGPDWGVTTAVVRRDTGPTHGIIYLPKKDIMVEAAKGHGCRVNGEVIDFRMGQVSQKVLQGSIVAAEIGKFVPDDRLQRLLRLVNHCMGIRNLFSSTGNTVDVLSGVHGAWVHLKGGSVWDFAAGALAIEEAGGFVCDLQGQPLKWDKLKMEVVFAVNEQIARDVVRILDVAEET